MRYLPATWRINPKNGKCVETGDKDGRLIRETEIAVAPSAPTRTHAAIRRGARAFSQRLIP